MDNDTSNWVIEFLIRSSVPDSLIQKTLTVLPHSGADSRLKKTLLLRTLQTHLLKASLSETTLQIFELLAELNHNDAIPVSDAMRRAYCAVAVESTVKYLAASPDDPSGEYFSAVRRVWRGRVAKISEEGCRRELLSDEMLQCRDDVEAALLDPRVSERLAGLNTRRDAMYEVKQYLNEAWGIMGPTFLDSMATMSKEKGPCPEGVCEFASGSEPLRRKRDRVLECSGKEKRDSVSGDRNNDDNDVGGSGGDDGACSMEDVAATREKQGKEQLEERVGVSVDAKLEVGGCDSAKGDKAIQKGNLQLRRKHSALRTCHRGVRIAGTDEVEPAKLSSKYDPLPSAEVNKVRESLKSSSMELRALVKDPLPDALHTSEVVRSKLATNDISSGPPIKNQSEDVVVPDPNVCMSIVPYQANDANLGKNSSVHCNNVHNPNLMERRSSAQTYEWDDSIDNFPQERQPRRRKRKWTSLEEETLRAGVKMFGEGNWATIRNFYSNIFEYRNGVDLKDKWRNMIR